MITLYGYWRSTAAYRVRIALNFKKIDYRQTSVHLVKDGGEQNKQEFKNLNPQSLVPTLVDDGFTLSQSMAILEYLEEKYPNSSLLPTDTKSRALVRQLCQVICADTHPLNNLRVLNYLSDSLAVNADDKVSWYHHWLEKGFKAYDEILKLNLYRGDYSIGRELSLADVCLIPQLYNARRFNFDLKLFPRLVEIEQKCLTLRLFDSAIPEKQPDAVIV